MLVLTRKAKQQIQIGPHITITILQIKGQAVRVGVEAPREVCVLRTEIAEKLAGQRGDPTVMAALDKVQREAEISSPTTNEDNRGQARSLTSKSSRCRVPHVDEAPLSSRYQSTDPASFLRPRRRRLALR